MKWGQRRRHLSVVVVVGRRPKATFLSWDSKRMLKLITTGTWLPRKPGSPACIQPDLKEVSSIVATKQGSSDPTSWEDIQKGETCRLQLLGVLKTSRSWQFPMRVHFSLPLLSNLDGFSYLIWSLSSQSGILGSRENLFWSGPCFSLPYAPGRFERQQEALCPWGNSRLQRATITIDLRFMKIKQYVPVSVPAVCLPMVQCSPFQPSRHSHLPSLQVPCSMQRGWQTRWSQAAPVQPSSQRQAPPMQTPWVPQSTEHTSGRKTMITAQHHLRWNPPWEARPQTWPGSLKLAQGPCHLGQPVSPLAGSFMVR